MTFRVTDADDGSVVLEAVDEYNAAFTISKVVWPKRPIELRVGETMIGSWKFMRYLVKRLD